MLYKLNEYVYVFDIACLLCKKISRKLWVSTVVINEIIIPQVKKRIPLSDWVHCIIGEKAGIQNSDSTEHLKR